MEVRVNKLKTKINYVLDTGYFPIKYNFDYYENEPYDEYKKMKTYLKKRIPDYFVYNKKMKLICENQEKVLNLTLNDVKSVEWLDTKCKMTFHNNENEFKVKSECSLFIKDYLSFMRNLNYQISHWHHKLIERSMIKTYFTNSDLINDAFYYLNYNLSTHEHKNMYCKNSYYYKFFNGQTFSSQFKRGAKFKPVSLQMQVAYCIIENFNSIDISHINTMGDRNVAKKIYFKVNFWANITLEAILLHKLYISQCKFKIIDSLMIVIYPYCQCKFSLTNGQCIPLGKCILCMSLQHYKNRIRFKHPVFSILSLKHYSQKCTEYLYCFCNI